MTIQRPNTPAPAPVAPLPPRGPGCRVPISSPPRSVPFSMPRTVPFSMPIDNNRLCSSHLLPRMNPLSARPISIVASRTRTDSEGLGGGLGEGEGDPGAGAWRPKA